MYNDKIKNVLLFVHIPSHFREIMRVATILARSNRYKPIVIFTAKYNLVEDHNRQLATVNIESIYYFNLLGDAHGETLIHQSKKTSIFERIQRVVKDKIKILLRIGFNFLFFVGASILSLSNNKQFKDKYRELIISLYSFFWKSNNRFRPYLTKTSRDYYQLFPEIFLKNNIKLLIFPEHNLFYFSQLLTLLGQKQKIPSVIVPFSIANTLEWAQSFSTDPGRSMSKNYNKLLGNLFPDWIYNFKNKELLLHPEIILIHEMLNIRPPNPWLINSGDIDIIAVESDAMEQYYVDAGLDRTKFRQIGALYNDILFAHQEKKIEYKKILYESLGLKNLDKPYILLALPPDQCDSRISKIDFINYEEIIRFILSSLTKYSDQYYILVNLHPRTDKQSLSLINDYPMIIAPNDIIDYIPLASLFIASVSATIRMAITCAIPVINYDLYRYHYNDYNNISGVLTIFEKKDYIDILEKLINDADYFKQIEAHQKISAKKWGKFDGQAGRRLLDALDALN